MKSVMISIKPKWCELIANMKKTIEVRKNGPKLPTPFKCYIYCTKEHNADDTLWIFGRKAREMFGATVNIAHLCGAKDVGGAYKGNGKVIGEFVCDNISVICPDNFIVREDAEIALMGTCVSVEEFRKYMEYVHGTPLYMLKDAYAWYISDLKIYDKPKELIDFKRPETLKNRSGEIIDEWSSLITRPPQSWCYVEEAEE